MRLNTTQKKGLEYVRNSKGGARKEHFIDDFEPVGTLMWDDLATRGWVRERDTDGGIFLTDAGTAALDSHA